MFNKNTTILITGGTGSFGRYFSEFVINNFQFKKLIIFSRDEMKQWDMRQANIFQDKRIRFLIGDVRDFERLNLALKDVDIVIHAAALKIVPTGEYDPMEFVKTNIYGAMNVINASLQCGVKKVVALSTDKASSPINLYGATKLTSDKLFIASNSYAGNYKTKFAVVRYGNIFGSRGSIIQKFLEQRKSNLITITDKNMTRFFMTLSSACNLVIHTLTKMKGGELFISKNPSINIIDIAKVIAPKAKIKITGLYPGEKLHEEMISYDESRYCIETNSYYIILTPEAYTKLSSKKINSSLYKKKRLFSYSSNNNTIWLKLNELKKFIDHYEKNSI